MKPLYAATDATWPAARLHRAGAFVVREGQGGGNRVSCATAEGDWSEADIAAAEALHRRLGQPPLFQIREGEDALDAALAARGHAVIDPVFLWEIAAAALDPPPPLGAFAIWPPLAILADIWAEGGIGPDRLAVMARAEGPKTCLLARSGDRPAGAAFAALHRETAMLHALFVRPAARRQGAAGHMVRCAASWATGQGARRLALAVTRGNAAANALYASLGFAIVGQYHYRRKTSPGEA